MLFRSISQHLQLEFTAVLHGIPCIFTWNSHHFTWNSFRLKRVDPDWVNTPIKPFQHTTRRKKALTLGRKKGKILWHNSSVVRAFVRKTKGPVFDPEWCCPNFYSFILISTVHFFQGFPSSSLKTAELISRVSLTRPRGKLIEY